MYSSERKNIDPRTEKTKSDIRTAYLRLLKDMQPEQIKVAEICRLVGINRGTFYLHYKDAEAVMEEMEDMILESVADRIVKSFTGVTEEEAEREYNEHHNDEMWLQVFLGKNFTMRMFEKIKALCVSAMEQALMKTGRLTQEQAHITAVFVASGALAVEKDRQGIPWDNFTESDGYYRDLLECVNIFAVGTPTLPGED